MYFYVNIQVMFPKVLPHYNRWLIEKEGVVILQVRAVGGAGAHIKICSGI